MAKMTEKQLLDIYKQVKAELGCHGRSVTRQEFIKEACMSVKAIVRLYGSYTNFVQEAEALYYDKLPQSAKAVISERDKKFDESATSEDCIEDLRSLQMKNPNGFITRNFYRVNGKYSDSTWGRYFGNFLEFRRQAKLELSRQQHALEKHIAKHASVDHYRDFFKQHVLPYHNKYQKKDKPNKIKTIIIGSDIHDEECDEFTLSVFIDTCKKKQPDIIVLNGDIFDCYEASGYSKDLRKMKLKERFSFVHERIFAPLRKACPDAQIDFIIGNHEIRILKMIADQTMALRVLLSDIVGLTFAQIFGVDKYQINMITKLDLGAFTKEDFKNEMKQNFRVYYGCYAVTHEPDERIRRSMSGTNGHHHAASFESNANLQLGSITWVQTPAMHYRDAEYLRTLSGWNMGFLEVVINTETKQVIQKIHQTHEDWTVIDGVFYERSK
jgi:hypothetical protein